MSRTDYRIFPWLKQHRGAHAGHRGAHALSKQKIVAEGEASVLLDSLPDAARRAAAASGLRAIKVLGKREYGKEIGAEAVRSGWESVAVYREDGTMLLAKDNPNLSKSFHHELAHALDPMGADAKFRLSESPGWLKACGWKEGKIAGRYTLRSTIDNRPVSEYGKGSPWEDFAESFAKYVAGSKFDHRVMQGESSKRYEYMAKFAADLGFPAGGK